ncbi:MAG: type II toxin-antitoxin system prevent-host-death family antitoxin [Acidobacteriota bacterium]|nr:type II toxin-antitoxin system prevent-host-death family antitoxin [Acidobacteriota bacterium]
MRTKVKTMNASEFKAKCLQVLDDLDPRGIVITKRGRPVARLTPVRPVKFANLYGCMRGKIKIEGDIFSTGVKWNAQS